MTVDYKQRVLFSQQYAGPWVFSCFEKRFLACSRKKLFLACCGLEKRDEVFAGNLHEHEWDTATILKG